MTYVIRIPVTVLLADKRIKGIDTFINSEEHTLEIRVMTYSPEQAVIKVENAIMALIGKEAL